MRYLFRGLRTDGEGWVYGYYFENPYTERTLIARWENERSYDYMQDYEVIPETVGQWTGLPDKNGVKIFEGDKLKGYDVLQDMYLTGTVAFIDTKFVLQIYNDDYNYYFDLSYLENLEVIGNIHEVVK